MPLTDEPPRRRRHEFISDADSREAWREASREARRGGWRIFLFVLGVLVCLGLLSWGIWALQVATSDVRGRGDLQKQVNSAENRRFAQENFVSLYTTIQAYDRQLDQAAADKAEHPGDEFYATNYTGLRKQCVDAVAQYDAAALKISQARFRDAGLPYQIDPNDPATDCTENTKPTVTPVAPSPGATK